MAPAPQPSRVAMTTRELIELEQTIDADPDIIWEACSTPRGLERWQADEVEGDVVPGRNLTLHFAAFDTTIELEVLDVVPGESVRMRSGTSIVEWIVGPNKITLRHTDTEPSEDPEGLAASWRLALVQLAHALEKHPYQARQVTWVVREASTSAEQAHAFFSDRTALNLWLTSEGEIGELAASTRFVSRTARPYRGKFSATTWVAMWPSAVASTTTHYSCCALCRRRTLNRTAWSASCGAIGGSATRSRTLSPVASKKP